MQDLKSISNKRGTIVIKGRIFMIAYLHTFVLCNFCYAAPHAKNFQLIKDGVIIYPDTNLSGNARMVRVLVIDDKIIRISASPLLKFPYDEGLITVYKDLKNNYTATNINNTISVKIPAITEIVLLSTGTVSFKDKAGTPLLMERQYNGRSITPVVFEGEQWYGLFQTFETTTDDAYYGLGQHQSDQFNYKGQQVFLFQNNNKVAVPFLPSVVNLSLPVFSPVCSRIVHLKLCG
ncbi:MAG: hypothetical protein ABI691_17360 [Ginsengibacter sp.]